VFGSISSDSPRRAATQSKVPLRALHCSSESKLIEVLNNIWKLEEVSGPSSKFTSADLSAEKTFVETHRRDADSRFVVRLTLKVTPPAATEETRKIALGSLHRMHRRFARNPALAEEYREFRETYEEDRRLPSKVDIWEIIWSNLGSIVLRCGCSIGWRIL
jgi:hypothetical protein